MKRHVLIAVLVVALPRLAGASPGYTSPLDDRTRAQALREIEVLAEKEGADAKLAELLLATDVIATMKDGSRCPGVEVDIVNATAHTMWHVELKIDQKVDGKSHSDTVHLPWMPAKTKVRVRVSCVQDYTTRSRYDYKPSTPISINYDAKAAKNLAEALPEMLEEPTDFEDAGGTVTTAKANKSRTTLDVALAMADPEVAHELVLTIARTGTGSKQLGDALAADGTGVLADEVVASMAKLPAPQQAQLARTLLASTIAERWATQLQPMIDGKLCNGPRADVMALWLRAQTDTDIPVQALRDRVRDKCKLVKGDGAALVAALDLEPKRSLAFDNVDADMFAGAVGAWKAMKKGSPSLLEYLRTTHDPKRFDAAAATLTVPQLPGAIEKVVETPANDAVASKAIWLEAALGKLSPDAVGDAVETIYTKLLDGHIVAPAMRDAARATRSHATSTADEVITKYAEHSKVFDLKKLAAAGVDQIDFLAFNAASLGKCASSVVELEACTDAIPKYSSGALVKAAPEAEASEFSTAVTNLTGPLSHTELLDVAKHVRAAGLSTRSIVGHLCTQVDDAMRYDNDAETLLSDVKEIDPAASCIAATADSISARGRKAIWMTIVAILGLIVPVPVAGFFIKRKWRKVKASLPASDRTLSSGASVDDRLGANGLGRALGQALAEAKRELASTSARRALDAVDDALLASVAATTARAVKSGDAASLIVKRGTDAVYIVALPIRQVRPQVVQRYLGDAWPEHLEQVRRAAGMPVLALIVLCGPDAAEATLLVGYGDGTRSSDPDALLDAREARDRGANTFRHVMALAAETTASEPAKAA